MLRAVARLSLISLSLAYFGGEIDKNVTWAMFLIYASRYEDEMPCMKLYKPAECYAAVSFTLLRFNWVQN